MKLIYTYLLITISIVCTAQSFEHNYLGDDFSHYKGVLFKLNSSEYISASSLSNTFYGSLKHCQKLYDNNVLYPSSTSQYKTEKDSLINKIFIVENIITRDSTVFIDSDASNYNKPIFVLKDTTSKEIIYFQYSPTDEWAFPFLTSNIIFNQDKLCSRLESKKDDFDDIIKINSPILSNVAISPMILYKYISKNSKSYYLSLTTYSGSVSVGNRGVIIIFSDGTKWTKNVEVDVDTHEDKFSYSAFIKLTEQELLLFMTKQVKKYRLYIFDREIEPFEARRFSLYAKCIKNRIK